MSAQSTSLTPPAKDMDPQALGQTFTEKDFSPEGMRRQMERTVVDRGLDDADRAVAEAGRPELQTPALAEKLHRYGFSDAVDAKERYQVGNVIGLGATGRVYSVVDKNLNRAVALKVLSQASPSNSDMVHSFVNEAQITASLQHPNVLPVYDLDVNEQGQIYFTTKKIEGRTLGDAIHLAAAGKPLPSLATNNAIIRIFIDIAHAVAYAHHKGIVHRDIKPDNIMLGDFGEVLLLDWGSAALLSDSNKALYGTPIYMAPEQARREFADQRSDIYCLGASLFHALTLQRPTWANDQDEFWRKKRAGSIDQLPAEIRRKVPAPLIDIMLKALAAKPSERYQSVDELLRDLENFQAGLAVSAHRDTMFESVNRWHGRHARAFWSTSIITLVIVTLSAIIYGERLKELASWGSPIIVEDFSDDTWPERWEQVTGKFANEDGKLVLRPDAGDTGIVLYRKKLWGDTAIEFDGYIPPGTLPCDLTLLWYHDIPIHRQRTRGLDSRHFIGDESFDDPRYHDILLTYSENSYQACIGAKDGTCSIIEVMAQPMAYNYFRPEVGVTYHIRVEIEEATISLFCDGKRLCRYVHESSITGGYFALYGFYAGKSFDNIRVFNRGVPQKVPATAVPDDYFHAGDYAGAEKRYEQIADSNPDSQVAKEAIFKRGACLLELKRPIDADAVWTALDGSSWRDEARLYKLEAAFDADDHDVVLAELESLFKGAHGPVAQRIPIRWMTYANRLVARAWHEGLHGVLQKYLDLHDRLFDNDISTDGTTAGILTVLGRFEEVLRRYPKHVIACCTALGFLGRDEEIVARYRDPPSAYSDALVRMGRFEEAGNFLNREYLYGNISIDNGFFTGGLSGAILSGHLDVAIRGGDNSDRPRGMAFAGAYPEAEFNGEQDHIFILMAKGQGERALQLWGDDFAYGMWPRHYLGLKAYLHGDRASAYSYFEMRPDLEFHQQMFHLAHYVIVPYLHELAGERDALTRACEVFDHSRRYAYSQRAWYNAQLLLDRIDDEAYLRQPYRVFAPPDLKLLSAIKYERAGKVADALALYQVWLEIPTYRRQWALDPVLNDFVAWRIAELSESR